MFKVGDTVKRIKEGWLNIKIGDIRKIVEIRQDKYCMFHNDTGQYDMKLFIKVKTNYEIYY